ncbi:esterase/lipase family protein [Duganella callida]|uniref:Alpha/beta hydrolase n=1 Tax=Duganella callida TaxID=2561932 RepID=A0A4Y9SLS3_9BURK|nr:alpha/beta hydrolase [Duganella callida]TFW22785.1 alpha/beta hydrolase [Duganella callida]
MTTARLNEPTRPVSAVTDAVGNLKANTSLSPKANTTRASIAVPPRKIMPVIVIAGIMGSNLRTRISASKNDTTLNPGEAAWRPPNGKKAGLAEAKKWTLRTPEIRQRILNGDMLEVDPTGEITDIPDHLDVEICRARGWGEIHADSYGGLLATLQKNLNSTFKVSSEKTEMHPVWVEINKFDREEWGTSPDGIGSIITEGELKKFGSYYYPVYGFGYNWLQSNEESAASLQRRIESIITSWVTAQHQCHHVVLVTHSMGGLVARACAKQMADKIAAVVHGVMPAWGAPACYRRLSCGTEATSPGKGTIDTIAMGKFAEIAGRTAEETTPVLAVAPGPLELLPNHLYPSWLFAQINIPQHPYSVGLNFHENNPYQFYKDFECWYRAIDLSLVDPAKKMAGNTHKKVVRALNQAEKFHRELLDTYYHPNSAAFYCADTQQRAFGSFRWLSTTSTAVSPTVLQNGVVESNTFSGARNVVITKGPRLFFEPSDQDQAGDGTVPLQSGEGPSGKISHIFKTKGYDHQGSYNNEGMLKLTQHLIVKLLQGFA